MPSEPLLPLFPLQVVLLPGAGLPLHIFEERYRLMIGEAIEGESEFGIVLVKENGLLNIGCTARVEKVLKRYPDGRLDILARGRRRFEILFLNEEKPYLQGAVHFFDDEAESAPPPEALRRLASLAEQALGLGRDTGQREPAEEGQAAFQLADKLDPELDFKQQLLSLRSEAERVDRLTAWLEKQLPRLQRARRMEKVAGGNGQG